MSNIKTLVSRQKELEMKAIDEGRGECRALTEKLKMGKPEMSLMTRLLEPFLKAIIKETRG